MGWLWSTTEESPSQGAKSLPSTSQAPAESANPSPTTTSTPEKVLSRDEIADQELQSFLKELEADTHTSSKKYNRVPRSAPPATSSQSPNEKLSSRILPSLSSPFSTSTSTSTSTSSSSSPLTSNDTSANTTSSHIPNSSTEPLSEQLLPTTMSCRTAFDAAFYCNSFGGRFNDLYRYGTLRSCSSTWNDFWFCMKTRSYSGPQKEEAIREHYRKKEHAKYGGERERGEGRSSEDVWRSRDVKVEVGEAFTADEEGEEGMFKGSDEEWNRRERERRRGAVEGTMG